MQLNIPRKIKTGMWVMTAEGQVGILTDIGPKAAVDLVAEDGTTSVAVQVLFTSLRQATLSQIPAPRRPEPEAGARLGYL
jgi:hypothetical protein